MDPGRARLCRGPGAFERDGRAPGDGPARNARSGVAHSGRDSGGALGTLCRGESPRRGVIGRLEQVAQRPVPRETFEKLEAYVALLKSENQRQNLISASTLEHIWDRHILDSAQLVRFEPQAGALWIDIGSGAGLPGIVVA